MKLIIENTSKIVEIEVGGALVPARIWEGQTDTGIPVHCYITRVATDRNGDCTQFERELREERVPSAAVQAIPLRLVL